MRILVDMNLSPQWIATLRNAGYEAVHWSTVGSPSADDRAIMDWVQRNDHVVFTHDLDFGTLLALTHRSGPSVVLLRDQDVLPNRAAESVLATLRKTAPEFAGGALVVIEGDRQRVRILPL